MHSNATAALESAEARIVTSSSTAWLEIHGCIKAKSGELIRAPKIKANAAQRIVDSIIRWCEANGIPCRIIGLKARQVGFSTISIGSAYHRCQKRSTNFLLIGDEYEKSVKNLESMFWRYAEHDTFTWNNSYSKPSGKFSNGSEVVTETANDPRAGASGTYQFVVATEVAHWKNTKQITAEKVFQAFMACVPNEPGTVVILESTANGEGNSFHTIYTGAISFADLKAGKIPPGWNGFVKVFYAWHEFPEYTCQVTPQEAALIMTTLDEREQELVKQFPRTVDAGRLKWRRQTIAGPLLQGNAAKFEEEYPSDEDSAFLATGSKIFPAPQIKQMDGLAATVTPEFLALDWANGGYGPSYAAAVVVPERDAWIKVYERPQAGRRYIFAIDPASGKSVSADPDNHAPQIWRMGYTDARGRWRPPLLAARLADCGEELSKKYTTSKLRASCQWHPDILKMRVKLACDWYGRAMLAIEANKDAGLIDDLHREGYPIVRMQKYNHASQRLEDFYGFDTTEETRHRIIARLIEVIRNHDVDGTGIQILDPVVIQELKVFVRTKTGRGEAAGGWHDDQVIAAALALECSEQASVMRERVVRPMDELTRIERRNWHGQQGRDRTYS